MPSTTGVEAAAADEGECSEELDTDDEACTMKRLAGEQAAKRRKLDLHNDAHTAAIGVLQTAAEEVRITNKSAVVAQREWADTAEQRRAFGVKAAARQARKAAALRRQTDIHAPGVPALLAAASSDSITIHIAGLQVPKDPTKKPSSLGRPGLFIQPVRPAPFTQLQYGARFDAEAIQDKDVRADIKALDSLYGACFAVNIEDGDECDNWWVVMMVTKYCADEGGDTGDPNDKGLLELTIIDPRYIALRDAPRCLANSRQLAPDCTLTCKFSPTALASDLQQDKNFVYLGPAVKDSIEVPHSAKSVFRDVKAVLTKHSVNPLSPALAIEPAASDIYVWVDDSRRAD